jgi:hypothetical protein
MAQASTKWDCWQPDNDWGTLMSPRRVAILLISSVLIVILAVWLSSNRPTTTATLPGLDKRAVNAVSEIRLSRGDGTRTTLKKGNTDWTVAERDYPADSGKVRKLLLDLATLNVIEEKTRIAENYPALGVEEVTSGKATGTHVEAVTAAKTYSLIVGKTSGANSGYVRVSNTPQSLLVAPGITIDADPRRWLDQTLIDIPQERIQQIAVKPAAGPGYTASRPNKEQSDFTVADIPKGRKLSSPAAADAIAGSLGSVTLDDVQHAPTDASATDVSHAVFSTFDGLKIDVAGHKEGTKTMVSLTSISTTPATEAEAKTLAARLNGWEFEIPSYKYDGLFRPLEDLLEKPPEPAAKGGKKLPAAGAAPGTQPGLPAGLQLPGPGQ